MIMQYHTFEFSKYIKFFFKFLKLKETLSKSFNFIMWSPSYMDRLIFVIPLRSRDTMI